MDLTISTSQGTLTHTLALIIHLTTVIYCKALLGRLSGRSEATVTLRFELRQVSPRAAVLKQHRVLHTPGKLNKRSLA